MKNCWRNKKIEIFEKDIAVSVLCITYNHEKYIEKALESFVMQKTNFNFEVVVHDDASTDKTASIIARYAQQYPEIVKPIYQEENKYSKGICVLRLTATAASGKYVALCEGDDYWIDSNKLQKQFDYMEKHPECSLVAHNTIRIFESGNIKSKNINDKIIPNEGNYSMQDLAIGIIPFHTSSMFFRMKFYADHNEFMQNLRLHDTAKKILLASEGSIHYFPDHMSAYRERSDGSWTMLVRDNEENVRYHKHFIYVFEEIKKYLNHEYDETIDVFISKSEFTILICQGDFLTLKKEPYKSVLKQMSTEFKVVFYMRKYASALYPVLRKLYRHRNSKR